MLSEESLLVFCIGSTTIYFQPNFCKWPHNISASPVSLEDSKSSKLKGNINVISTPSCLVEVVRTGSSYLRRDSAFRVNLVFVELYKRGWRLQKTMQATAIE